MRWKVPKWHSLGIKDSTGRKYDPKLQLDGKDIGDCTIKFLGGPISVPQSPYCQKSWLVERLELLLQQVDAVPVTRSRSFYSTRQAYALS